MNAALVKIDVAAIDLRRSVRRIEQLVDGGSPTEAGLLWIFNLAINPAGRRRDLRFWRPELLAHGNGKIAETSGLKISQVIAEILPLRREHFQAGEIDQLFQIRHNTRIDLDADLKGKREGTRFVYRRELLETFLQRRWLGNLTGVARRAKMPKPNFAPAGPAAFRHAGVADFQSDALARLLNGS